ncbi:unnamed protein product [Polarella glacialis]|uniref:Uncharacterized protein n=1 Tax=Polarella glacialis TaxID=89957 RepID=A0A813HEJ3_POLGL|nr:unnamed protein product [Polarella glacialis]
MGVEQYSVILYPNLQTLVKNSSLTPSCVHILTGSQQMLPAHPEKAATVRLGQSVRILEAILSELYPKSARTKTFISTVATWRVRTFTEYVASTTSGASAIEAIAAVTYATQQQVTQLSVDVADQSTVSAIQDTVNLHPLTFQIKASTANLGVAVAGLASTKEVNSTVFAAIALATAPLATRTELDAKAAQTTVLQPQNDLANKLSSNDLETALAPYCNHKRIRGGPSRPFKIYRHHTIPEHDDGCFDGSAIGTDDERGTPGSDCFGSVHPKEFERKGGQGKCTGDFGSLRDKQLFDASASGLAGYLGTACWGAYATPAALANALNSVNQLEIELAGKLDSSNLASYALSNSFNTYATKTWLASTADQSTLGCCATTNALNSVQSSKDPNLAALNSASGSGALVINADR